MNARFWTHHNGEYVKVTLRPGQTLEHYRGGRCEEGYSWEAVTYHYDAEEGVIERGTYSGGRDCDGPYSRTYEDHASISELAAVVVEDFEDPLDVWFEEGPRRPLFVDGKAIHRPNWRDGLSEQRDYFAEAAGY